MKKIFLSLFITLFCLTLTFARNKEKKQSEDSSLKINVESLQGCKEVRLSKGSCKVIIESLQSSQENDSIAIEIFKEEYRIVNMKSREKEYLLKKNYKEIIQYFSLERSEKYHCTLKNFKPFEPILLVK